jgi:hypothetical protein
MLVACGPARPPAYTASLPTLSPGPLRPFCPATRVVESLQDSMEKAPRHATYRALVERGAEEGRVVLTRDRTFVAAAYSDQVGGAVRCSRRAGGLSLAF